MDGCGFSLRRPAATRAGDAAHGLRRAAKDPAGPPSATTIRSLPFSEPARTLLRALRIEPETIVLEGVAQGVIPRAADLGDPEVVRRLEALLERFAVELLEAKSDAELLPPQDAFPSIPAPRPAMRARA